MKHFFHIVIFAFFCGQMNAQESHIVSIHILDGSTQNAIRGVHIKYANSLTVSDQNGLVILRLSQKIRINITHISYRDTTIFIDPKYKSVSIQLQPKISKLPTAQVSNEAYAVFSPETTHVFDYEFIADTLLVLTYEREQMFRKEQEQSEDLFLGCKLVVVSPSGNITHTSTLPDYTIGFHRDGLNQLFIKGRGFAKMVTLTPLGPNYTNIDVEVFQSQIIPLKNSSTEAYYFDDQVWDYPEFSHYSKSISEEEISVIRTISDSFTMELFRAAYKYMHNRDKLKAIRLEYETGIDKEIYGAYMSGFQYSLYYQPIYAPMFCIADTAVIFDHHNYTIYFHDLLGHPIDSIALRYNEKAMGKFDKQLIQDPKSDEIYAIYKKTEGNT